MDLISVSPWGIVAAAIAGGIVGALWFSPLLFATIWAKHLGMSKETMDKGPPPVTWFFMILCQFGTAFIIAALRTMTGISSLAEILTLSVLLFVCSFALPTLTNILFARKSPIVWLIEAGYVLTVLIVQSVVLYSL